MMHNIQFEKEKLYFCPLGGAGHFGANLNLYVFQDRFLLIDLGMGFPDTKRYPGVDLLLPDIRFLQANKNKISGLVVTHVHEDHIGGIPYLWPQLKCPIYATPFAASIIRKKIRDYPWAKDVDIRILPLSSKFNVGPFDCELMTITHSTLEPNAVIVRAGLYNPIFHTGDWKLDDDPIIGDVTDLDRLDSLAEEGVLAVIGDSTNAIHKGHSGSEAEVRENLISVFEEIEQRIAVTCFSSNIARLVSIAEAAEKVGRHVALAGQSLSRMVDSARECGYDLPKFLSANEGAYLPRNKVVFIVTGSQGEPRSTLYKIAYSAHKDIELEAGDTVVYSSRVIPGNDINVIDIKNRLIKKGLKLIDELDGRVLHVSGHPYQDELAELYHRLKPSIAIPVHGETQMLYAHARLADDCDVPQTFVPQNGVVYEFDRQSNTAEEIARIDVNMLGLDGTQLIDMQNTHVQTRRKIAFAGVCCVALTLDDDNNLCAPPSVTSWGLIDNHPKEHKFYSEMEDLAAGVLRDGAPDQEIIQTVSREARRYFKMITGKKPLTKVLINRVK